MTYQEGDPNHLGTHNQLTADVGELAALMGVDVTLPDEAVIGATGHVSDHNLLAAALDKIATEGVPPMPDSFPNGMPSQGTNANSAPVSMAVRMKNGTRALAHILTGNTGTAGYSLVITDDEVRAEISGKLLDKLAGVKVPEDFTGDPAALLPKDLREYGEHVSMTSTAHPSATYTVDLFPGVLQGALIAAGATGGTTRNTAQYGGGGGAGGYLGLGRTPIVIPGTPGTSATFTVTVGSTSPGGFQAKANAAVDVLNGQPTFISDASGLVIAAAVGGGHGGCHDNVFQSPGQGGSGGGTNAGGAVYPMYENNRGVPGQGFPGSGSTSNGGAGGGAGAPANGTVGGDGVDLITLFDLDPNDSGTQGFASTFTDDGYVCGGGGGFDSPGQVDNELRGGKGGGGGGWYSGRGDESLSQGRDYLGGGGGATFNGTPVRQGGAGMVVLLGPA